MALAAILSKMGMENQVKPLMSFQAVSCCGEPPKAQPGPVEIQPLHLAAVRLRRLNPLLRFPRFRHQGVPLLRSKAFLTTFCSSLMLFRRLRDRHRNNGPDTLQREDQAGMAVSNRYVQGCVLVPAPWGGHRRFHLRLFPQDVVVRFAGPGNPFSIPIAALIGVPVYIRPRPLFP